MAEQAHSPQGYGNIYTPHAGEMIIQVHRASGLAHRNFILGPRSVRVMRWFLSRTGLVVVGLAIVSWIFLAVQAARIPHLTKTIGQMQADAARLDTLEHTLTQLNQRYDQLQRMMASTPGAQAPTSTPTPQP